MSENKIEIFDAIAPEVYKALEAGLIANAIAKQTPPYKETPLSITLRNDADKIIAGMTGKTFWNWLYFDILWVDEAYRGQGLGAKIVRAAEEEAVRRGCHSAYLWTQDWEGATFYPKFGYTEFVVKQDFPIGHKRIGMLKRIAS